MMIETIALSRLQTPTSTSTSSITESTGAGSVGGEFMNAFTNAISETAASLKNAETMSASALEGKASVQQVVESVMAAERQFQTAIAIRDKIVSAYLELNRMQV
jgi:flagellar hook-basal body complex protein FliE